MGTSVSVVGWPAVQVAALVADDRFLGLVPPNGRSITMMMLFLPR